MYEVNLNLTLECSVHPDFEPQATLPAKRCRVCQAISHIYEWVSMAERKANKLLLGIYQPSDEVEEAPVQVKIDEIADIAGEPGHPGYPGHLGHLESVEAGKAKKRPVSTSILNAPENPTRVRRKL